MVSTVAARRARAVDGAWSGSLGRRRSSTCRASCRPCTRRPAPRHLVARGQRRGQQQRRHRGRQAQQVRGLGEQPADGGAVGPTDPRGLHGGEQREHGGERLPVDVGAAHQQHPGDQHEQPEVDEVRVARGVEHRGVRDRDLQVEPRPHGAGALRGTLDHRRAQVDQTRRRRVHGEAAAQPVGQPRAARPGRLQPAGGTAAVGVHALVAGSAGGLSHHVEQALAQVTQPHPEGAGGVFVVAVRRHQVVAHELEDGLDLVDGEAGQPALHPRAGRRAGVQHLPDERRQLDDRPRRLHLDPGRRLVVVGERRAHRDDAVGQGEADDPVRVRGRREQRDLQARARRQPPAQAYLVQAAPGEADGERGRPGARVGRDDDEHDADQRVEHLEQA